MKNWTVITHNGHFHTDEVLAWIILKLVLAQARLRRVSRDSFTRRTREDHEIWIDIGFDYNHARKHYDHHQQGGAGVRKSGIPYASAGLVWRHYGYRYLRKYFGDRGIQLTKLELRILKELVDTHIIESVDALDTRVANLKACHLGTNALVDIQPFTTLVAPFNPSSLTKDGNERSVSPEEYDLAFSRAVVLFEQVFDALLEKEYLRLRAEEYLATQDKGEPILVIDIEASWELWTEIVPTHPKVVYVVHPNGTGSYHVHAAPKEIGASTARAPFPEQWRGKTAAEFSQISRVKDAEFCHNSGFVCGAKSLDGALRLARLALEDFESRNRKVVRIA